MRTFKLTDDCTLSGVRLLPDDRRVEGGGYVHPNKPFVPSASREPLVPAHGVAEALPKGMKKGEKIVPLDYNRSS